MSKAEQTKFLNLLNTAKTAKGPGKLKALSALVTMLGAGAVYKFGFSPTEVKAAEAQAGEAQAGETGVVDKAKSWPIEHPWLTGGAATGATAATKPGRKLLGKAFRTLGTPLAGPLWAGWTAADNLKSGKSLTESVVDPWVGMELMFPKMFKENVSKITKNPLAQKILKGKFIPGSKFIPGIGTAITLGSVARDSARAMDKESKRIEAIEDPETQALEMENFVKSIKGYYASGGRAGYMGGGIAAIRKPSAIAPTGGPQSQGLASTPEYDTYNKEYKWQT
jgi:hypothetical protein